MIANELNKARAVFGKPAAIRVEHHGEVILQSGEFQPVREGVDGTFRVRGGR